MLKKLPDHIKQSSCILSQTSRFRDYIIRLGRKKCSGWAIKVYLPTYPSIALLIVFFKISLTGLKCPESHLSNLKKSFKNMCWLATKAFIPHPLVESFSCLYMYYLNTFMRCGWSRAPPGIDAVGGRTPYTHWGESVYKSKLHLSDKKWLKMGKACLAYFADIYGVKGASQEVS